MGFFALCRSEVEVHSRSRVVKISPSGFLGKGKARLRAPRLSEEREFASRESPARVPWWQPSNRSRNSIR
jgi:hypothetical protein